MGKFVFVSYSHGDYDFVKKFVSTIKDRGVAVMYDDEMLPGDDWSQKARHYVRNADCAGVIVCLSRASMISKPVLEELKMVGRYEKPYVAVNIGDKPPRELFNEVIAGDSSDEVKDIADDIYDFLPSNKIYLDINNASESSYMDTLARLFTEWGFEVVPDGKRNEEFSIVSGADVTDGDIEQALALDYAVYPEEYHLQLKQCLEYFSINNNIYVMLRDNGTKKIVAYVNISPVTEEYYEKIRSGRFIDTFLPPEALVEYDLPAMYNLYFSSVVIHPEFQNKGLLKYLYKGIVDKLIELGENDIIVSRMVADAVSHKGVMLCELFGMNKVEQSDHESTIFEISLCPPRFNQNSVLAKRLYDFYAAKAQELDGII